MIADNDKSKSKIVFVLILLKMNKMSARVYRWLVGQRAHAQTLVTLVTTSAVLLPRLPLPDDARLVAGSEIFIIYFYYYFVSVCTLL